MISPLLSNIYLDPLDHLMSERGFEMVRYADDFVVLCRGEEEACRALEVVRLWRQASGLTLHPEKTRVVDATIRGGASQCAVPTPIQGTPVGAKPGPSYTRL